MNFPDELAAEHARIEARSQSGCGDATDDYLAQALARARTMTDHADVHAELLTPSVPMAPPTPTGTVPPLLAGDTEPLHEPCADWEPELIRTLRTHTGSRSAITAQELGALVHVTARQIRARISHLRSQHDLPLCSRPSSRDIQAGFYWARTMDELLASINGMASRIREQQASTDGMRRALSEHFGTPELPAMRP
jgi:hypothetical protein